MNAKPVGPATAAVQVVGPVDGWILERIARKLASKLPYAEFVPWRPKPNRSAAADGIAYYVNYALYEGPSGLVDVGFFTHEDESQGFLERARRMDFCVCMSRVYAERLASAGVEKVTHIPMGFDFHRYRSRLVLGVVGKLDHPRKGRHLVERLRQLPFVEIVTTEGRLVPQALQDIYSRIDYVLIPSSVEGGPMCLLEGLAMGKPVIAPEGVGMVPEFGASPHVRLYRPGDCESLERVVAECRREQEARTSMVADRTWDRWAEHHHRLFGRLLADRGRSLPEPVAGAGFRFGMMDELEVPASVDPEPVEGAVDAAARHLFYGRTPLAKAVLQQAARSYPFLMRLADTLP